MWYYFKQLRWVFYLRININRFVNYEYIFIYKQKYLKILLILIKRFVVRSINKKVAWVDGTRQIYKKTDQYILQYII